MYTPCRSSEYVLARQFKHVSKLMLSAYVPFAHNVCTETPHSVDMT
jgi:hypothetical protein